MSESNTKSSMDKAKKKAVCDMPNEKLCRIKRRQAWWKSRSDSGKSTDANPIVQRVDVTSKRKSRVSKNKQFVLFVGNLPYSATTDDIKQHFSQTGGLIDVRLLTKQDSGESRGCAYVEFNSAFAHKAGLRLHNSLLGERKINVEFTSPGRKTTKRMQRLKEKNEKAARLKVSRKSHGCEKK